MTTGVKPQDMTVTANGLKIHYLDWGTVGKPYMVLLHGLRGHAHSWDDVSTAMYQDFHVLSLDQRGRGDSDWAPGGDYSTEAFVTDLGAFSEVLALDTFVLVGHSMGGRIGMAFTARYPEKVQRLVIVDVGPDIDPKGVERITRELREVPEEFDSFDSVVEYMAKQNCFASPSVLWRRLQYATQKLPNGKFGWRYDLAVREQRRHGTAPPAPNLWPALEQITCPTLIVRGADSDTLGEEVARRMERDIVHGRLVEVPRAGHMVFEDNPEDFISQLTSFLR